MDETPLRGLVSPVPKAWSIVWIILTTSLSLGLNGRFLRAILEPVPPLVIDWSPVLYGFAGFFCSALALQAVCMDRVVLTRTARLAPGLLNGLPFTAWLICLGGFVVRSIWSLPG